MSTLETEGDTRIQFRNAGKLLVAAFVVGTLPSMVFIGESHPPIRLSLFEGFFSVTVEPFNYLTIPCATLALVFALITLSRAVRIGSLVMAAISIFLILNGAMQLAWWL